MCIPFDGENYYHKMDSYLFSDEYASSLNIVRPANTTDTQIRIGSRVLITFLETCNGHWHYLKISRKDSFLYTYLIKVKKEVDKILYFNINERGRLLEFENLSFRGDLLFGYH